MHVCVWHVQVWNQGWKLKTYLTHTQTHSTWISAKPHMLNMSTNCLICSYRTRKLCQAGLESGYALLGGTYKGFYRKHIVCPYGLVKMAAGWRLHHLPGRETCSLPQSPGIRGKDGSRAEGDFWNIWGRQWLGELLGGRGKGVRGKEKPAWQSWFFCTDAAGRRREWEQCVQLH